jgi:MFS family permease
MLAATGMITASYSVIALPLAQEYNPGRMVLMLAMTVVSAVGVLLSATCGGLLDRVNLRWSMTLGGLLLSAGFWAISMTTSFSQVLWVYALLIAPANVLIGPLAATVLLSRWFSSQRGKAMGLAMTGISIGMFTFPLIVSALLTQYPWRDALQLLSVILIGWTVPAAWMVSAWPPGSGDGATISANTTRTRQPTHVSARRILSDPAFWMLAFTVAIVTGGMKGVVTNLASLGVDTGATTVQAARLISIYAACSFLAKLSFAALSDRLGARRILLLSLTGYALSLAVLTQAEMGYGVISLGVAAVGFFGGLMLPMESFVTPQIFGAAIVGRAMGLLTSVILLVLLATPPLFGLIFDLTGSYRGIFWTFCGVALATLLMVPRIRLTPRAE